VNVRAVAARVLPPLVLGVLFLAAWEAWVNVKDVQPFIVPKPSAIWESFVDNLDLVRKASFVTGINALIGLVGGVITGFAAAALVTRFRVAHELLNPLAVTMAAIPAVVIVGVLNNMYAVDSQIGRRIMVTVAVFFIVYVQVATGLRQSDATQLELMRSYAVSPRQTLLKVRLPNTMPFLFTAIRIAAPVAVIIALVSEYFGGPQDGLGSRISGTLSGANRVLAFAYVIGGSIVGLVFFAGSNLLEHLLVPWRRHQRAR
jgi:NitT/TauT family transport system permease protein